MTIPQERTKIFALKQLSFENSTISSNALTNLRS